jgi:hypothetical protein
MRELFDHDDLDLDRITASIREATMRELASGNEEIDGAVVSAGWAKSFQKTNDAETGSSAFLVGAALAYARELKERL